jgi:hypothetical protein
MLVQQGGTFADTDAFESKARAVCGRARMAGRASKLHHGGIAITSFSMPLTIAGPRLPAFLRYSPFSPAYPLEGTELNSRDPSPMLLCVRLILIAARAQAWMPAEELGVG